MLGLEKIMQACLSCRKYTHPRHCNHNSSFGVCTNHVFLPNMSAEGMSSLGNGSRRSLLLTINSTNFNEKFGRVYT